MKTFLLALLMLAAAPAMAEPRLCSALFRAHTAPTAPAEDLNRILNELTSLINDLKRPANQEISPAELGSSKISANLLRIASEGQLLNQTDPRLHQLGLIVPNGGLCATTCLINLVGAVAIPEENARRFNEITPGLIALLVQNYALFREFDKHQTTPAPTGGDPALLERLNRLEALLDQQSNDARRGADPAILVGGLKKYFETSFGVSVQTRQRATLNTLIDASSRDSIMLITANLYDLATMAHPTVHGQHALLLLKVLPATQEVIVSDPNQPNLVFRERYAVNPDGTITFRTRIHYTSSGTLAVPFQVEIIARP